MAGSHEPEKEMRGIRTDKDGYGQPPRKGLILSNHRTRKPKRQD
jgi:hypothetical protein